MTPAATPLSLAFDGRTVDGGLYTDITRIAHHTPAVLDRIVADWSAYGLVLFALLMLVAWWRARGAEPAAMAQALAVPPVVVAVFGADLLLKSVVREPRPCQAIPGSFTLADCPAAGDWSFPSNHTVIAFTAAAGLWVMDRRLGAVAALAAVAMGASRVFIGVHYPHDVLAGAFLGTALGWLLTGAAHRAAPLVVRLREGRLRVLAGTP